MSSIPNKIKLGLDDDDRALVEFLAKTQKLTMQVVIRQAIRSAAKRLREEQRICETADRVLP